MKRGPEEHHTGANASAKGSGQTFVITRSFNMSGISAFNARLAFKNEDLNTCPQATKNKTVTDSRFGTAISTLSEETEKEFKIMDEINRHHR